MQLSTGMLFCMLFFSFCNVKNGNKEKIKKISKNHFVLEQYNKESLLTSEQEFIMTDTGRMFDGYLKVFYENGKIMALAFFKNNEQDSVFYSYYENGGLHQKEYFFHNERVGPRYIYYENGKINRFDFFTFKNVMIFTLCYNMQGNIDSVKGHPIYLDIANEKETYSRNDTVIVDLMLCKPDGVEAVLTLKYLDTAQKWHETDIVKFKKYSIADIPYFSFPHFCTDGSAKYVGILSLYDSLTKELVAKDSVRYNIKIK